MSEGKVSEGKVSEGKVSEGKGFEPSRSLALAIFKIPFERFDRLDAPSQHVGHLARGESEDVAKDEYGEPQAAGSEGSRRPGGGIRSAQTSLRTVRAVGAPPAVGAGHPVTRCAWIGQASGVEAGQFRFRAERAYGRSDYLRACNRGPS